MKIVSKENIAQSRPRAQFAKDFDIRKHIKLNDELNGLTGAEFIGTDSFGSQWYERQRYEIDSGRELEPLLYQSIYEEIVDGSFPRNVTVFKLGPGAVVFEEVVEGGEVKFATVGESQYTVPIKHYAVGLEYNKDLVIYNELWNLSLIERQAGVAYNALLNHIHLAPILNYGYGAANQTAAVSSGDTLMEDVMLTFESAITSAANDTDNPRRGPYTLLVSTADLIKIRKSLSPVAQQGFTIQSADVMDSITSIVAYNGWTGMRGKIPANYAGVATGKAYLIDNSRRTQNFLSLVKQPLQSTTGNEDVSRFILEQVIWDTYFGVYANPAAAVEEITLPT